MLACGTTGARGLLARPHADLASKLKPELVLRPNMAALAPAPHPVLNHAVLFLVTPHPLSQPALLSALGRHGRRGRATTRVECAVL